MATPILIDSNVILDILTEDKNWFSWSSETLMKYAEESPLAINPIIYAELSIRFERIEELEAALEPRFFFAIALDGRGLHCKLAVLSSVGRGHHVDRFRRESIGRRVEAIALGHELVPVGHSRTRGVAKGRRGQIRRLAMSAVRCAPSHPEPNIVPTGGVAESEVVGPTELHPIF